MFILTVKLVVNVINLTVHPALERRAAGGCASARSVLVLGAPRAPRSRPRARARRRARMRVRPVRRGGEVRAQRGGGVAAGGAGRRREVLALRPPRARAPHRLLTRPPG